MRPGAKVELLELELLVSVAQTGSLGQAAVRHGLSQPAVSMRMTGLERALGLRLLDRDASGTRLTAAGQEIVSAARSVLGAGERLAAVAGRLRAEAAGQLRVAASFTVAEHLAPAWIEVLRSEAPTVALTLDVLNSSGVLAAVEQRRVECGFVEGVARKLPGMQTKVLTTDELVVVVAPGHPWFGRSDPVTGSELAATELVVREQGSGTREVLDAALEPWGGVTSRLELGSSAAVLAAARKGEGPAVLSQLAAEHDLGTGELGAVATDGIDLSRTIQAVWASDTNLGHLARRLLAVAARSSSS